MKDTRKTAISASDQQYTLWGVCAFYHVQLSFVCDLKQVGYQEIPI